MNKILIVEDHIATAMALKGLLTRAGYAIEHAACGEAALGFLNDSLPALVILDISMPGISGKDVLKQIRSDARTQNLPVIVFSAFADDALSPELLRMGANECWLKSKTDALYIVDRVATFVDRPAA